MPLTSQIITQTTQQISSQINNQVTTTPPAPAEWILEYGIWNDAGRWDDNAIWNDGL